MGGQALPGVLPAVRPASPSNNAPFFSCTRAPGLSTLQGTTVPFHLSKHIPKKPMCQHAPHTQHALVHSCVQRLLPHTSSRACRPPRNTHTQKQSVQARHQGSSCHVTCSQTLLPGPFQLLPALFQLLSRSMRLLIVLQRIGRAPCC